MRLQEEQNTAMQRPFIHDEVKLQHDRMMIEWINTQRHKIALTGITVTKDLVIAQAVRYAKELNMPYFDESHQHDTWWHNFRKFVI